MVLPYGCYGVVLWILRFGAIYFGCYGVVLCLHFWLKGLSMQPGRIQVAEPGSVHPDIAWYVARHRANILRRAQRRRAGGAWPLFVTRYIVHLVDLCADSARGSTVYNFLSRRLRPWAFAVYQRFQPIRNLSVDDIVSTSSSEEL